MTENYKIVIDSKSQKDGTSKIYCRIITGKIKKDIFFDVRWPRWFYDQEQILIKPRFRKNPDAELAQPFFSSQTQNLIDLFSLSLSDYEYQTKHFIREQI